MLSHVIVTYIAAALTVVTATPITSNDQTPHYPTSLTHNPRYSHLNLARSPSSDAESTTNSEKAAAKASFLNKVENPENDSTNLNTHSASSLQDSAHSPTPSPSSAANVPQFATANTTAATHEKNADNSNTIKAPSSNSTRPSVGSEKDAHANASHGEPLLLGIPSCFHRKRANSIRTHHCEKALEKVVYAANQTLDKFSSLIFANYKTCNINIHKPKNATITKAEVGFMVHNITESCHSVGGVIFKTPKMAVTIERSTAKNTYEVDTTICKKEECPLTQGDCLSAFFQIPLDHYGRFGSKNGPQSYSRVTSGNCTVTLSTTDYSNLYFSRDYVYPYMKKLSNECGNHPGKIYISGGSIGFNGDLKISTRSANDKLCQ